MPQAPRIIAKLRSEDPRETWGLYLPDEDRWLSATFRTEREAKRFCADLTATREPSWP